MQVNNRCSVDLGCTCVRCWLDDLKMCNLGGMSLRKVLGVMWWKACTMHAAPQSNFIYLWFVDVLNTIMTMYLWICTSSLTSIFCVTWTNKLDADTYQFLKSKNKDSLCRRSLSFMFCMQPHIRHIAPTNNITHI